MVYLGKNKRIKISKKQAKAQKKQDAIYIKKISENSDNSEEIKVSGTFMIPKIITVRKFAQILQIPVTKIIEKLIANGIMASINESIDFDTASIIADDFGATLKLDEKENKQKKVKYSNLKTRPAVVVVLGHVDHGKTSILDAIRKSDVASGESGGITQHIGAYQVNWKDKQNKITPITFLDTPGHEAFSTMRAHGANITDIAILVVAADDGVKPQTKEAISHIKSANIPVIVAINKIDKPEANIERVKKELGDHDLVAEEWGGDTPMIEVSAKNKIGIDKLLDTLLFNINMHDFKSQYDIPLEAVVIESHMQEGLGPVATILIKHGVLKKQDFLVIGDKTVCKTKIMEDYLGNKILKATPGMPVKIAGLSAVPNFADKVLQVSTEREAKNIVNKSIAKSNIFNIFQASEDIKAGKLTKLNIILKTDTQGSLEAIKNTLEQLSTDKVKIKIIFSGVGSITDNDLSFASGNNTLLLGFKVKIDDQIAKLAKTKKIAIKSYDIIYRLIEDVQSVLSGMVEPEKQEVIIGKAQVIKIFYKTSDKKLVGAKIIDGKFVSNEKIKILHSSEIIGEGKVTSLQIEKEKKTQITKGFECGISISSKIIIKPGDILQQYKMQIIE